MILTLCCTFTKESSSLATTMHFKLFLVAQVLQLTLANGKVVSAQECQQHASRNKTRLRRLRQCGLFFFGVVYSDGKRLYHPVSTHGLPRQIKLGQATSFAWVLSGALEVGSWNQIGRTFRSDASHDHVESQIWSFVSCVFWRTVRMYNKKIKKWDVICKLLRD